MTDPTWTGATEPEIPAPGAMGWVRVLRRGVPALLLIAVGFTGLAVLRLVERPLFGMRRPVTPWITVAICRAVLRLIGIRCVLRGRPVTGRAVQVANHASWLDILVLNAQAPLYFVAKSEVAAWPGIGWLGRATGTVFIDRNRRQARAHTALFEDRLLAGHSLVFFPEGTSTDGLRVLPFKTTLFAAFLSEHLKSRLVVQPVSLVYQAPPEEVPWFYGWWGAMEFGAHALHVLAAPQQGHVTVTYHAPLVVADFPDRKILAAASEAEVRAGFDRQRSGVDSSLQ